MTDGTAPTDDARPAAGPGRRRAPRSGPGRWLVGSAVATLATVLGLTLALRSGAAPACAAPTTGLVPPLAAAPTTGLVPPLAAAPAAGSVPPLTGPVAAKAPPTVGATVTGKATFYDSGGAGGNCSYPSAPADRLYVALGPGEYAAGAACGGYLTVTGPKGSVRVLVTDQCPECAPGHVDLSKEAFARIADPVRGIVPVSYRLLADPPLRGPLTFRIKEGASQYWFAVLVADHGNPLRAVEVRQGGSGAWRTASRASYNYWLIDAGAGPGPYQIRVTDTRGHRATATGIRMAPGQVQRSGVRMYGGGSVTAPSATPSRSPSASASPTPRPVATSAVATPTSAAPAGSPAAVAVPGAEPLVADGSAHRCG